MPSSLSTRGSSSLEAITHYARPKINIELSNQADGLVKSYTSKDRIEGIATVTVDRDTRFDEIDITFEGMLPTVNYAYHILSEKKVQQEPLSSVLLCPAAQEPIRPSCACVNPLMILSTLHHEFLNLDVPISFPSLSSCPIVCCPTHVAITKPTSTLDAPTLWSPHHSVIPC